MRTITTTLIACAAAATLAASAHAHEFPTRAKQIKSSLVQNYAACTSPDTATNGGARPACGGEPDPIDTICTFGGGNADGSLTASISGTGIKAKAKLKGLSPTCDGQTLTVAFGVRTTTDDCPGGHCIVTDETLSGGTCVVTNGRCTISTIIPTAYPAGSGSEMTVLTCGVNRGLVPTFACGIMVP